MQFVIDGTTYEAGSLERITGLDALELPRQAGLGIQTLARRLDEMSRLGYDDADRVVVLPAGADGADSSAVMDSEPHLRALLAFLWLSRRLDGDKRLTFDESCGFQFTTLQIIDDEPVVEVAPDPTQPGSDPVTDVVATA